MTRQQFQREKRFQAIFFLLRQTLLLEMITPEEFMWSLLKMIDKYHPVIGSIMR